MVKRIDTDEKSSGGIIIPDTAKEKPSERSSCSRAWEARRRKVETNECKTETRFCLVNGQARGKTGWSRPTIMKESDIMGILD